MKPAGPVPPGSSGPAEEPRSRSAPPPVVRAARLARQALEERPWFSIRMQMLISFGILILAVLGIAWGTVTTTGGVRSRVHFFERVARFCTDAERAVSLQRRASLTGSSPDGAVETMDFARALLVEDSERFEQSLGGPEYGAALQRIDRFCDLVSRLPGAAPEGRGVRAITPEQVRELREHGDWLVGLADSLLARERSRLDANLARAARAQQYALLGLLVYTVAMAILLIHRIARPFNRFYEYAKRIAAGNITPITPARGYSDEFSVLAILLNQVLAELDRSQRVAVQGRRLLAVSALSASVAHEINNPVNNILLTASALLEDYEETSEEERRDLLEDIRREARRTGDIIHRMLELASRAYRDAEYADLCQVCHRAREEAARFQERRGIRVICHRDDRVPLVLGDQVQLTQVVQNLIQNAADASREGDTVEVSVQAHPDGRYASIVVRDRGTGIPDHVLPRIFEPFFTTKDRGQGTGLGLAISREIVERHGGTMTLDTEVGKGTTVTLLFPLAQLPADLEAQREERNANPPSGEDLHRPTERP